MLLPLLIGTLYIITVEVMFLPKEDDFFNVEYYRNLIEKEVGYRVMILDWKEFTEEQYQLILKENERNESNGIAKAE